MSLVGYCLDIILDSRRFIHQSQRVDHGLASSALCPNSLLLFFLFFLFLFFLASPPGLYFSVLPNLIVRDTETEN